MKMLIALLTATVLLAACSPTPSETAAAPAATPASSADAMAMSPAEHDAMAPDAMASDATAAAPGTPASATGTVESVDVVNGKITIAHGPVAALKWPAMTMAFAATPEQLQAVKAGQQVDFDFLSHGMSASLTSIHPR